ncbi:MAG: S-methyl-5'-thioadenosine phosphorylase [Candidatus Marinimicrobia bacterium]|nr:S-methyl-5'-thioadenosine phosphorylase [Candidatus Neomarinimicrobiota bacterium]|tara:strand:- start:31351 stop:32100 length:750 start_codon:yes stop_codon:yes gene_type:complete
MRNKIKIGIIGGSGMEDPAFISDYSSKSSITPYGSPSSDLIIGNISDSPAVILSRHGLGHTINPTNINYRANIYALKQEGCTHILAVTACGSLRKRIEPGHFVFPDQFIDFTSKRMNTFFDGSDVKHISMSDPFSFKMRSSLVASCIELGFAYHDSGTLVTIEGPRFSTKAESKMFRSWGCDVINMSTVPEVILARELQLEYQAIAMSTDYDCWHESEEDVTMEMIYAVMSENVGKVKKLLENVILALK